MKVFGRSQVIAIAGMLIAAPVLAQTSPTTTQPSQPQSMAQAQAQKQKTQDGNSPTTVGPGSKAYKQKTQGDLPEVGPASGAYGGNNLKSKY